MSAVSRGVVYTLLVVVAVLLLGIAALLRVASQRNQRLEDATIDFQRSLSQKEGKIKDLQQRLHDCDTIRSSVPDDSGWGTPAAVTDSAQTSPQTTKWSAW